MVDLELFAPAPPPNFESRDLVVRLKYFVVTKRFSWWIGIVFVSPPPNLESRDLVVKYFLQASEINRSAC